MMTKMVYFVAHLLHSRESIESMLILSLHFIAIFIYIAHDLIGSVRLI